MLAKARVSTKKSKVKIATGVIHIYSTFNNTIVTITDITGNTLTWASAGSTGFKGARKGTPFAAQSAAEESISNAVNFGLKTAKIVVKGEGPGREAAMRAAQNFKLNITSIEDITAVPHNGCRPPKKRRV
uniref:ribosomal protein S11 n=1 Tax=Meringosphaera mediterranea TaxID=2837474 RepID=UPI00286C583E|nr:ribosomal protein S11 [Meringosphaera mediterranea]WLD05714.1 ribosomal protein S11 [Meringosphaera mediterranea]WLD05876.1 ribosomal protein S11 [Meringosphaera mediterranea]WLD06096.1 ribosomal protein S11 [Meringosphaera mediterranea]